MPEKPLSNEKIKIIIKLSEQRLSRPTIAKEAGCSKNTVYRYQTKNGLL